MPTVTIKNSQSIDTLWLIQLFILGLMVYLLFAVITFNVHFVWCLLMACFSFILNQQRINKLKHVDLLLNTALDWCQLYNNVIEKITVSSYWVIPHVVFIRFMTPEGALYRMVPRNRIGAVYFSRLVVALKQQDNVNESP